MKEIFFELIRVAIGTQESLSRLPSSREWGELYKMAKKQSLVGVCFAGLQKLGADVDEGCSKIGMSEMLYLKWMGMAAKIQQRNKIVNGQCVEVQQMIEKAGFQTFIMKGQGNAILYNEDLKMLRQSGDIDIYLEGGFEKVNNFVQGTHPTKEINELEIHYHCLEDTEVEIHYRPFIMRNPIKNAKLQRFFRETMKFDNKVALPINAGCINVPTTEFNLVHQMAHIHLHLFTEGIGMRQLLDYFFVLKARNNENVLHIVHNLGLDRFASALMWVMVCVFGLPEEQMLCEPNEKDGQFLLNEIMTSGNFGKHDERQKERKSKAGYGVWALLIRNLRLSRFDRGDWFWGPLWRVYHFVWRKTIINI